MASEGFSREQRLVLEGELRLSFADGAEEDDRIFVGKLDLHDLLASEFAEGWENLVRCGRVRVVVERII